MFHLLWTTSISFPPIWTCVRAAVSAGWAGNGCIAVRPNALAEPAIRTTSECSMTCHVTRFLVRSVHWRLAMKGEVTV